MQAPLDLAKTKNSRPGPVQVPVPELQNAQLAAAFYDQRVGGDYCDFLRVGPGRVLFALLDIAGRLQANRPVISAVETAFRESGAELFAADDVNEANAIVELCLELNRIILETAGKVCSTPAFAGCYNEIAATITYLNSGHTPGLLRDGEEIIELPANGLPLGLFTHAPPDAAFVALEPGSALVLVSRGVVEARRSRQEFGLQKVKQKLLENPAPTAPELCTAIFDSLREFTGKTAIENDATVVALARKPAALGATASR